MHSMAQMGRGLNAADATEEDQLRDSGVGIEAQQIVQTTQLDAVGHLCVGSECSTGAGRTAGMSFEPMLHPPAESLELRLVDTLQGLFAAFRFVHRVPCTIRCTDGSNGRPVPVNGRLVRIR